MNDVRPHDLYLAVRRPNDAITMRELNREQKRRATRAFGANPHPALLKNQLGLARRSKRAKVCMGSLHVSACSKKLWLLSYLVSKFMCRTKGHNLCRGIGP